MVRTAIEPMACTGLSDWKAIWNRLEPGDKHRAMLSFLQRLRDPASRLEMVCDSTLKTLARRKRFRVETLRRMKNPQLAGVLLPNAPALFGAREWTLLFLGYFADYKSPIMCRFLDLCGVPHDERGFVVGGDSRIRAPKDVQATTQTLVEEFGVREVAIYFCVLTQMDPDLWRFLDPVLPELTLAMEEEEAARAHEVVMDAQVADSLEVSEDFTQLDRVILDQILATLSGDERALKPNELVDLVESVHALDTTRQRTYFHLGFMDALLPERETDAARREMDDEQRQWYLSGMLSAHVRQRDDDAVKAALSGHGGVFRKAAKTPGGAGAGLINEVYGYLLEQGYDREAMQLLRGQRCHLSPATFSLILDKATTAIREGDPALANVLLVELRQGLPYVQMDPEEREHMDTLLERRLGQALQAQGNFIGAREVFARLIEEDRVDTPCLLADRGLVSAGFRSLADLVLPEDPERCRNTLAQLENGETYFREAVARFERRAINAHHALAVLEFLRWAGPDGQDAVRDRALVHVNEALIGMLSDTASTAYERLGLLGQCRFMQAVLMMARLDQGSARAGMESWRAIAGEAERLPRWGVQRLLESADLVEPRLATEIAECVWRQGGESSLAMIERPEWLAGSAYLQGEVLRLARSSGEKSGAQQWRVWTLLVPAALLAGHVDVAQEGLDAMEALAQDSRFCEPMLKWLEHPERLDPAWSEVEILRSRFRLYRRLGRDPEAFAQLRALFYALRDTRPMEASQTLDLFRECDAPEAYYADLHLPGTAAEEDEDAGGEEQLRAGAPVKVLFVGGNEIQARYTDAISRTLAEEWPGVVVSFRHTGWSSNWGRDVDVLKRQAVDADAVVLMTMMRTTLGRALREALNDPPRPWIPCTGTGKQALLESIRRAARVGLQMQSGQASGPQE
ncbi:hypothetical protein [Ectothiorhodospira variabilis]|uniref:hypothetical protein n=1 Tax=Ectothiorhodospira variabilis TaxID=505694 RepID=UPI001EFAB70F|nr:hypothetical protein [Ectothiorhodospira variabilis]MCG5494071.1 hypothetical protein [Ectothiorhodospira variabilis]MCG5497996.1 hypothetical protein [Ectothiorhodospira variabilis]MCG5503399.1 hypothetical protein [Ectothiorhodospira variabilis]MCG5506513.1 hypothetical protein [Ectothiorhodospira variabilis]